MKVDKSDQLTKEEVSKNSQQHVKDIMHDVQYATIGKLSAGITHEINTPLTYIKGTVELMRYSIDDLENGPIKKNLLKDSEKLLDGIRRIEHIITSMQEMSQKNREEKENINIFKTLRTSLVMAYSRSKYIVPILFQGETFTLDMPLQPFTCNVLAQHQRLEQAWIIIINNALDSLEKQGSYNKNLFRIDCEFDEVNVLIRFSDNGEGIQQSILETLFDTFVSTKDYGGIGIGLNIAQKIIHDHNGTIRAYNSDIGAVIEVKLPLNSSK